VDDRIRFVVPGLPVPDARPRAVVRWRRDQDGEKVPTAGVYKQARENAYHAAVRWYAKAAVGAAVPLEGPLAMVVVAKFPWLASHTPKKRAIPDAIWKSTKPDGDNLFKLAADACQGICFKNDSQIAVSTVVKMYADQAELQVVIRPLRGVMLEQVLG
jgi:Holliday junction resolvase RusA-like endonuclease